MFTLLKYGQKRSLFEIGMLTIFIKGDKNRLRRLIIVSKYYFTAVLTVFNREDDFFKGTSLTRPKTKSFSGESAMI